MLRSIAALVLMALPLSAAPVTTYELENGLEIVVIEDHRAPVVEHMLWYRAGAADETPGVSGIAHFLEHLLFKATDTLASGEFSEIVAANGGTDNAFTSQDTTAYHQRVAADRLGLMMQMEADRMRNIRLTEDDIATERQVILEERNQRTDSSAGALFGEQRRAAQYLNHPYGIPVIGWKHEMEDLSLDDALTFYRKYYAPNNAILIVAGDVRPDDVLALAKTHYGPLEPTVGLERRERVAEPPQIAERRLTYTDPRVAQPYVIRTYLAPERNPGDQTDAAALLMLSEILGGSGVTSVLGNKLTIETQQAVHASAFYSGTSLDKTTFGLIVVPTPDKTLEQAEAALDTAIAVFMDEGVDEAHLERIKRQVRAGQIFAEDNVGALARRYGTALTSGLTIADVDAWPGVVQAVTSDDIMAAAIKVFDRSQAVTGYLTKPQEVTQ